MKLSENPLCYRVSRVSTANAIDIKGPEENAARKMWAALTEKMPDCAKCHHVKASRATLVHGDAIEMSLSCGLGPNALCPVMMDRPQPIVATGVAWGELVKSYMNSSMTDNTFRDQIMQMPFRGSSSTFAAAPSSHIRGMSADMLIFDEAASFGRGDYERPHVPYISPNKDLPKTVVNEDVW